MAIITPGGKEYSLSSLNGLQSGAVRAMDNLNASFSDLNPTSLFSKNSFYAYPNDLQDSKLRRSAVIFYINEQSDSKFKGESVSKAQQAEVNAQRNKANSVTMNGGYSSVLGDAAKDIGDKISKVSKSIPGMDMLQGAFGSILDKGRQAANAVTGQNVSAEEAATANKEAVQSAEVAVDKIAKAMSKQMVRLKGAVMLYMPPAISFDYGASYTESSIGTLGGLAFDKNFTGKSISDLSSSMSPEQGTKLAIAAAKGVVSSVMKSEWLEAAQQKAGVAINPRTEVMFVDMAKRNFSFQWNFAPKSSAEYQTVKDIIQLFKEHMHPEFFNAKGVGAAVYKTPSDFNIEFVFAGGVNPHIPKISTCVLESMQIQYNNGDSWVTHSTGEPVEISLSLKFRELETLTRERVRKESKSEDAAGGF